MCRQISLVAVCAVLISLCGPIQITNAQATTWDGGGADNNWTTAENWVGDTIPANNGTHTVVLSGSTRLNPVVDMDWNIRGLQISDSSFNLSGSQLTIGNNGIGTIGSVAGTFNNPIALDSASTWNGDLTFEGPVNLSGLKLTTIGSITINGDVGNITILDVSGQLTLNNNVSVAPSRSLDIGGPGTLTITNPLMADTSAFLRTATLNADMNIRRFHQIAGIYSGILTVEQGFTYQGGTFAGRLVINGDQAVVQIFTFVNTFTAGDGIVTYSDLTVPAAGSLILDGGGLDNKAILTLDGGTLAGNGPLINGNNLTGWGSIDGSGGFINDGLFTLNGGHLTVSNTGSNSNSGNIDLAPGLRLRLTGGALSNTGTLNLNSSVVTGTAMLENNAGGVVTGRGTISAPFANSGGTLLVDVGTVNITQGFTNTGLVQLESISASLTGGALINSGSIEGHGSVGSDITNNGTIVASDGTLALSGVITNNANGRIETLVGSKVLMLSGLTANSGNIHLGGGTFDNNGFPLANQGLITGSGTFRIGGTGLSNNGSVGISFGTTDFFGDVTNNTGGKITIGGGAHVTFYDDLIQDGTFLVAKVGSTTSVAVLFGAFTGSGGFKGDGDVFVLGDLRPGNSPANVTYGGNLFLGTSTATQIELGGTTPGSQHDQVNVTANVAIDGTLDITLLNSFAPDYFDEFKILTAGSRQGKFDHITGAQIDPDMVLAPVYDHNGNIGLTLVAALPGDATLDGTVNGDDLLRWQANLFNGDEFVQGDFNLDGAVNGDDLLIWQSHLFDTVPIPAPATAPIPEPGTAALLLGLGMLGMTTRRRAA